MTYLYDDLQRITASKGGVDGTNNKVHTAFEEGHSIWYFRAFDYVGVDRETGAPQFRNHEGKIVNSSELTDEDMTDIGSAIPNSLTVSPLTSNIKELTSQHSVPV